MTDVQNVVLVHGGFVDGSGWRGVYDLLKADGFNVSVVQNQTLSLASDVETTHNVLDQLDGPAILVGHSYGGAVITEAGRHERVAGLVYIAAFAPDPGESVNTLIADPPPGAPVPPILALVDGFLFLDRDKFAASFAADLAADDAAFFGRLAGPVGRGRARRRDHRTGATVLETAASHSIYVSQPRATADLIKRAPQEALVGTAEAV
jgi:pimeloyl-ACP methyl ester carboxylesterase